MVAALVKKARIKLQFAETYLPHMHVPLGNAKLHTNIPVHDQVSMCRGAPANHFVLATKSEAQLGHASPRELRDLLSSYSRESQWYYLIRLAPSPNDYWCRMMFTVGTASSRTASDCLPAKRLFGAVRIIRNSSKALCKRRRSRGLRAKDA